MTLLEHPIIQFIIGGTVVSLGTYLSSNVAPFYAALIAGFPLELIIFYLSKKSNLKKDLAVATIPFSLAFSTFLLIYIITEPSRFISHNYEILTMILTWLTMAVIFNFIDFTKIRKLFG